MEIANKFIAITGSTGGIGKEICFSLAKEGANFIFVNRNLEKSKKLAKQIQEVYPNTQIKHVVCDFSNFESVKKAIDELKKYEVDVLLLNSGIFNVPLKKLDSGFNNIFQVNFLYQYYMARTLAENGNVKKVVATGSIAYRAAKFNAEDIDYSNTKKDMKVYGNSKRFLMISLSEYFKGGDVPFVIAHPGVAGTNLTSHYPKWINWFVKIGMKILFSSSKKAAQSLVEAVKGNVEYGQWIGPKFFDIWGKPKRKPIKDVDVKEREDIANHADKMYDEINEKITF